MNDAERLTQQKEILAYLEKNGSATVRDLFLLNINDPRKRISELRKKGYGIPDKWETRLNSQGQKKRYKRYYYFYNEGR